MNTQHTAKNVSPEIETIIFSDQNQERIDAYLAKKFTSYSRSFWQRAIQNEAIKINNKPARNSTLLKQSDIITISFKQTAPHTEPIALQEFPEIFNQISIIDEQEHFLVINKPAGVIVHKPSQYCKSPTLVDWLITKIPDCGKVGHPERPGIVHRLDKDTSGIMLVAKTHYGHFKISALFKDRAIKKEYLAFVSGHPEREGTIDISIGRNPTKRNQMTTQGIKARDALTTFKVLSYFDKYSLMSLSPHTGRTHQIRVHCSSIGHTLIGDTVYGSQSPLIERQALHAHSIAFNFDGINFNYRIPMPQDMEQLNHATILST